MGIHESDNAPFFVWKIWLTKLEECQARYRNGINFRSFAKNRIFNAEFFKIMSVRFAIFTDDMAMSA